MMGNASLDGNFPFIPLLTTHYSLLTTHYFSLLTLPLVARIFEEVSAVCCSHGELVAAVVLDR